MTAVNLALGTAQFGLAYGIAGRGAAVPDDEIRTILERAAEAGLRDLDTAPAYGTIEARLAGLADSLGFHVTTKVPGLPPHCSAENATAFVEASVEESRRRLGPMMTTLLFHRAEDLLGPCGDAAWRAAERSTSGVVRLGVSGYGPADIIELRRRYPVEVAQLPGNVFDQRLAAADAGAALAGIDIHLRSVFLQGLLLLPPGLAAAKVPAAGLAAAAWHAWCVEHGRAPIAAALAVARGLPGVRLCVVGVDTVGQLTEIIEAWARATPCVEPALACQTPDVIDPRRWTTA